jgi:hypothetical protein
MFRWQATVLIALALALTGCPEEDTILDPADDDAGDDDTGGQPDDDDTGGQPDDDDTGGQPEDVDGDGYTVDDGDCDDGDPDVYPGAPEICDGLDNDCDPATDEDADLDGDGFSPCDGDCDDGDPLASPMDGDGDGYSACGGDCDDGDSGISPAAAEVCDGVDNDCDGLVDDDCADCSTWVPADHPTIVEAMEVAVDGDVICVEPGTYPERIDFMGLEVHLLGVAGPVFTILDGGGSGPVVSMQDWELALTILEGFTVTGGADVLQGGGILLSYAGPTLRNLVVTGNQAQDGGGLYMEESLPVFERVEFRDNYAADAGAGLYMDHSSAAFDDVQFVDNSTDWLGDGGGMYASESSLALHGVLFQGNHASSSGGGLQLDDCPDVDVDNAVFDGNSVGTLDGGGGGGGLYVSGTALAVTNSSFIRNSASYSGGAVDLRAGSSVTLTNVIVAGNLAGYEGGGLSMHGDATVDVVNGVFVGNNADHSGGAVQMADGPYARFENVIVAYNEALYGGGFELSDAAHLDPSEAVLEFADVWDNAPGDYDGMSDPVGTDGNVAVQPLFLDTSSPDPAAWDLHLALGSPLVDAGSATAADPDGGTADVGVFGGPAAHLRDLDGDGYPLWWQPGPYDHAIYPAAGWDCDDGDPAVHPGQGC